MGNFYECSSLKQISISLSVTEIEEKAFRKRTSLNHVVFESPSSVCIFNENSFDGCSTLEQIILPSSIVSIENEAFLNCSSLKQISIPFSTTYTNIGIDSNVKVIRT
ncbi:hypothetical protein M9Y10_037266 [Tritrichomonas musculus]|uniref:Surface antigen BspA-like n=1 Tax=Tritrichomonas musculus TaxID=1915356 RepID=A0ABR2GSZ6_9EUKA